MNEKIKTWEDIKSFDDIILEEERRIIKEMENRNSSKCPDLMKKGNFFYYCAHNFEGIMSDIFSHFNPIYLRHVCIAELQIDCMSDYKKCCFYQNKIKR